MFENEKWLSQNRKEVKSSKYCTDLQKHNPGHKYIKTSAMTGLFQRPNSHTRNFFSQYLYCLDLWRLNN